MQSDHEQSGDYKVRRSARLPIDSDAMLWQQDWHRIEVMIRDISPCGFMAECSHNVQIGSYVSLDVPGIGPVQAQVRWQVGWRMGGEFVDPISLSLCEWTAIKVDAPRKVPDAIAPGLE